MTSIAGAFGVAVTATTLFQLRVEIVVGIVALLFIVPVGNKLTQIRRHP